MSFTGSSMGRHASFWLIVTGMIELGLAVVFLVLGLTVPFADFGLYLTAAILASVGIGCLLFGLRLRRSVAATERLLASGLAGQATITGLTQTGMRLNDNPQVEMDLRVSLPDREPYAARRKEFVPLILLGRLTSGAPLPVRVDQADPQRLVIDWQSAGPALPPAAVPVEAADESLQQVQAAIQSSGLPFVPAFASAEQGGYTLEQLRAHLRQHGLPATARIDQVMDMDQLVGDERLFMLQLTLELPGRPPEQLKPSAAMVPLSATPKVKVGWRVPVRVAADNHQLLTFEWERV